MNVPIEMEKFKFNLNSLALIIGFISTFALIISTWSDQKNDLSNQKTWIVQHEKLHDSLGVELGRLHAIDAARDTQVAELSFRIGSTERGVENNTARMNAMTENSTNQFTDFRTQLNQLATSIALTNQILQRMEAIGKQPKT